MRWNVYVVLTREVFLEFRKESYSNYAGFCQISTSCLGRAPVISFGGQVQWRMSPHSCWAADPTDTAHPGVSDLGSVTVIPLWGYFSVGLILFPLKTSMLAKRREKDPFRGVSGHPTADLWHLIPLQSPAVMVPGKRWLHTGGQMCTCGPLYGVINAYFAILISVLKSSSCMLGPI